LGATEWSLVLLQKLGAWPHDCATIFTDVFCYKTGSNHCGCPVASCQVDLLRKQRDRYTVDTALRKSPGSNQLCPWFVQGVGIHIPGQSRNAHLALVCPCCAQMTLISNDSCTHRCSGDPA
jgi:hypothetical protein